MKNSSVRRVLIYRLGSIGDTVVALPALHLIARSFPNAERRVLTNATANIKAAPMAEVIGATSLVHDYFFYSIGTRHIGRLWELRRRIAKWSPDVLVYLTHPRGPLSVFRDALFFHLCGITKLIGIPYLPSQQNVHALEGDRLFESEAHRLIRCLHRLGDVDLENPRNWDLHFTREEVRAAEQLLADWTGAGLFITVGIGTKAETKNWGRDNWYHLIERLSTDYPELGLVLLGSRDERADSEQVAMGWRGPKLNLCGTASVRVSAAVTGKSILFFGHDSGPMHLAAATGIASLVIFSARNKPGEWFPAGKKHRVIYKQTDCFGCRKTECCEHQCKCIRSITVEEVIAAARTELRGLLRSEMPVEI